MAHTEKMYLVPKHELNKLREVVTPTPNIRQSAIQRLDSEIREILQRRDLADDVKIKTYTEILQRYLALAKHDAKELTTLNLVNFPAPGHQPLPNITHGKDTAVSEIITHVNPRFKKNTELLLNKMLQNSDITTWNDKSEFIYKGDVIPGSNMLDLVRNTTQSHGLLKSKIPHGWDAFMQAMAELNMPSTVVGNSTTREILDGLKMDWNAPPGHNTPQRRILPIPSTPAGVTKASLLPKKRTLASLQTAWLAL